MVNEDKSPEDELELDNKEKEELDKKAKDIEEAGK